MTVSTQVAGFHLADGKGYTLGHDSLAMCRLNLQIFLWRASLGFTLHPSIPLPTTGRIADLATGTALWLTELAQALPADANVQLDGLDLDLSKAPPHPWLPANVHLHQADILAPLPDPLVGQYEVVHLRLLILVVENSDPTPIIRYAHRMLKSGGYIQWDDLNYPDTHVTRIDPASPTPAFDRLREFVYSKGRHDWVMRLDKILTREGFVGACMHHFTDRRDLIMANGHQHLMTMLEFAGTLRAKGLELEARDLDVLLAEVSTEAARGAALSMPRVVCVARKP
ncbi:hypothetical protein CBS63078_11252 [Aspergillus niger]|uniref:Methyltransferase domain-containing protein n=2 Tax=Aspergillus niger TaxID=5061 RepID=G3Y3W7_ASPNA|nr:hypothetical protein ASPNIDRAFT_46099 [Aspergillus niger ATCC 1015]KAI2814001.1 hypothetical protein CBS133816_10996 [Aspergillus niger]KAI2861550.1 hypothetical protein CBS13152_11340 [Aspergillus niger]KAI2885212.1 hypothetical protein CBS63078_11252 [Aspergillus niger]KAI2946864.1 hypothetical protein CBS147323_11240 [Aspergillus niger]